MHYPGEYLSLTTFKRDGSGVATPMWFVEMDNKIYMFTDGTSWKVKRLRRNSDVQLAECTRTGKITGPSRDARAVIVEDAALSRRIYQAVTAKYGWQVRLLNVISTLGGRIGRRKEIEITL